MHSPNTESSAVAQVKGNPPGDIDNPDYWNELIDRREAARFVKLAPGTLDNFRQAGIGPSFIRLSARCIRYTRRDLREWAVARMRTSTSDPGPDAEAA